MKKINNIIFNREKGKFIWMMRQAGRYLPEYQKIRGNVSNFLDLCYNPKLASKITMQPVERFDFDAVIIFADILLIVDALGYDVEFKKDIGPIIETATKSNLKYFNEEKFFSKLNPVFENIKITKKKIKNLSLIGFAGSVWTVACYMIQGSSLKNFQQVRKVSISDKKFFRRLIDILIEATKIYIDYQVKSGVEIIKLFDSWSGLTSEEEFTKWIIDPNEEIISYIKQKYPNIITIFFPKGAGIMYEEVAKKVSCDILAIDQNVPINWANDILQKKYRKIIQGNLDNFLLAFGTRDEIKNQVIKITNKFSDYPFIFNLGHGILPSTPIENVELVIDLYKNKL